MDPFLDPDFFFWDVDVNDDSLFAEHDEYLASLMDEFSERAISAEVPAASSSTNSSSGGKIREGAKDSSTPKPVVSKHDKRRTYAKLFSEALNSGDPKQLSSFLDKYCTKDCITTQSCATTGNLLIPQHMEVKGSDAILKFWSNAFITIPDCLLIMLETKLRIRGRSKAASGNSNETASSASNISSFIVCSFSFTGTKIYATKIEGAKFYPAGARDSQSNPNAESTSHLSDYITIPSYPEHWDTHESSAKNSVTASNNTVSKVNYKKRSYSSFGGEAAAIIAAAAADESIVDNSVGSGDSVCSGAMASETAVSAFERFNVFLHPPRKYSTLAGTPFGGNVGHYSHAKVSTSATINEATAGRNESKRNDCISIDSSATFIQGRFMEGEGYMNFLGTLTMSLDTDNKISRFEFLYSHMD